MPSFSKSLEAALHRALEYANERNHEYATLEHLLLSLLDDRDAAAVMRACNVDVDTLRRRITDYLDQELMGLVIKGHGSADAYAFEWAIKRAYDAAANGVIARIAQGFESHHDPAGAAVPLSTSAPAADAA